MKRREFIALLTAAIGAPGVALSQTLTKMTRIEEWGATHDRVFLGGEVWANPMEDWRVDAGWAACQTSGSGRNIHSLSHELTDAGKPFTILVQVQRPDGLAKDGGAGLRLGITADIDDYRAACFANNGIRAGLQSDALVLGKAKQPLPGGAPSHCVLMLVGKPSGDEVDLTLSAADPKTGQPIASVTESFAIDMLRGHFALASQFTGPNGRPKKPGYRFRDWRISGDAFTHHPERAFGPILWSMYSLSDNRDDDGFVMKLTALLGPMGEKDNKTVGLEIKREGKWQPVATAELDTDAWTATFRVPNWNEKQSAEYRVVYMETKAGGNGEWMHTYRGIIRANPTKPLRIGALTCQNAVGFPYKPVADNLVNLDPDLLYFSGDQLYEAHGGFGVIRKPADPAILNYLRKFYMFGWAFRDAMANAPTICLPDDHDVFHGNIWGEAGAPLLKGSTSSNGGYIQPAKMVNVVHKTNCSHHPDFASPRPVKQDISVYYGDMVYGNVGFAIIADRQWKSGPEKAGNPSKGRRDHVSDRDVDTSTLDKEGLVLLGERQEKFLEDWASDWRGHTMKVVLSQTIFANVATHHGGYDGYLVADLDSGSWPQTPRNRAIDLMRPAMPLHICGDQHLASAVQYGVEKQRDSNWAFCTPAITVGYQRWWRPDEVNMPHNNRPAHNLPNTGEYLDGLGNKAYVYASANPGKDFREGGGDRYDFAHRKNSGFGLVTIDTDSKTYKLECFKFLIDATDGKADNQFPGWPLTIHQAENKGDNRIN